MNIVSMLGKGNRFLGDLCDADVLIHVVDASGSSDRDGNVVEDRAGSSPLEDVNWIREELHRWIYGNICAKWSSVVRLGTDSSVNRLIQLFSGYQGPRSCIIDALQRSELDIKNVSHWSSYDLHKLVAFYLSIRFPICIALNKIDLLNEDQRDSIQEFMRSISSMGEVAVPVCAAAESLKLLKRAKTDSTLVSREATCNTDTMCRVVEAKFGADALDGVLRAISAAVMLRPPVLCFPVSDLATELPIGSNAVDTGAGGSSGIIVGTSGSRLSDCILLKPGSTVEDVYLALKRGELPHIRLSGDFVRAEGKSLDVSSRHRQLGRDVVLDENNCIIRIQTNRKSVWQAEARRAESMKQGEMS